MTITSTALATRVHDGAVADDDPAARPRRRAFTAEYKLAILEQYDRLDEPGAKGALLRREGLYSSHIVEWRRARDAGAIAGLAARPRPARLTPEGAELARVRRRAERAETELAKTRLVIEIQGKASELLGRLLAESDDDPRQSR